MEMTEMKLPDPIQSLVCGLDFKTDTLGRSEDEIYLFEDQYVLKCSSNIERLRREYQRCLWLENKLPVPRALCFLADDNKAYFLRTMLSGKPLCDSEYLTNPELAVRLLAKAFLMLQAVDAEDCPFSSEENEGDDFVHGDLCLPNILIKDNGIVGFIDIGNCGRGDKYFDISWAVWSLGYNLGTNKYTKLFLDAIRCSFSMEKYEKYVLDLIDHPENRKKYEAYIPSEYR